MTKKLLGLVLSALSLSSCGVEDDAIKALRAAGYSNIEITGMKPWACSADDLFRIGFQAKGLNGQPVEGVVCSAPLKGSTIRTY